MAGNKNVPFFGSGGIPREYSVVGDDYLIPVWTPNGLWGAATPSQIPAGSVYLATTKTAAQEMRFSRSILAIQTQGYSDMGDGGGAFYVRSPSQPTHDGKFRSRDGAWWEIAQQTIRLEMFGSGLAAWLAAASVVNAGIANTLVVSPGTKTINRASLPVKTSGIIAFRSDVTMVFQSGCLVEFDYIDIPLFTFIGLSAGEMTGAPKFRFTGTTPVVGAVTRAQFYAATGFPSNLLFGGDYELWSLVLSNSSGMIFRNFDVASTTPGTETNIIPFVFNLKPLSSTTKAAGNCIFNATVRDIQHGILFYGQSGIVVDGVDCDRRAGVAQVAPGHVLYCSGDGSNTSQNVTVSNVLDGPNPINWPASYTNNLGTLAVKFVSSAGEFSSITSRHPAGLIQVLQSVSDSQFSKFFWVTDDSFDTTVACVSMTSDNTNNVFENFNIRSPNKKFVMANTSSGVFSNNLAINFFVYCDTNNVSSGSAIFDFNGSGNTFSNISIRPSDAISSGTLVAYSIRQAASTQNYLEATMIGPYVTPAMTRMADASNGQNYARFRTSRLVVNDDYLNNDALPLVASKGSVVEMDPASACGFVDDAGGSGATTVSTIKLPGRGTYLVSVDVENPGRTAGMGATYVVTFSDQAATISYVQIIGTAYTRGAGISGLTVSVATDGVLTIGYTKSTSFFGRVSVGWTRFGVIAT